MVSIFEKINGNAYDKLIALLLKKCDTFTFALPNFSKETVTEKNHVMFPEKEIGDVEYVENGTNFDAYQKRVAPKIELIRSHIVKEYCDVEYGTSLYGYEHEIYVVKIDESLNMAFFENEGLHEWLYPNYPEDLCFYRNGICFLETVAHESYTFLYCEDEEILALLDEAGFVCCEENRDPPCLE